MKGRLRVAACAGAVAAGAGVGCSPTFEIDVLNTTQRSVRVEMTQSVFLDEDTLMVSGTVEPGESRLFGPVEGRVIDAVNVSAVPEGDRFAFTESIRINPGRTSLVVEPGYGGDLTLRKDTGGPSEGSWRDRR